MNDFTKEELLFIFEMLQKYQHGDLTRYSSLYTKLQSMIDNCCKHKWSTPDLLNIPFHCVKCGVKNEWI